MTSSPFLINLKSRFSPSAWRDLLLALRQEGLVWEALEKTELGRQALEILPPRLEKWSPAMLSLLAQGILGDKEHTCAFLESLCSFPTPPLESSWKDKASKAYEACVYGGKAPQNLAQSGLLALALRERYRLNNSWQGVLQGEILRNAGKTTLACLYGMISHPQDLLHVLLQSGEGLFRPDLVVHVLLSNPLSQEGQRTKLVVLCGKLNLKQILAVLCELVSQRPWMAAELAQQLLDSKSSVWMQRGTEAAEEDIDRQFEALINSLDLAQIYRVAAQPDRAVPLLAETLREIRRLRGHLSARLAQAVLQSRNSGGNGWQDTAQETGLEAWKQAVQLVPDSSFYLSSLALAFMEAGRFDEARSTLENQRLSTAQETDGSAARRSHPALSLASAMVALQLGDGEEARQVALQTLDLLESGQELRQSEYVTLTRLFRDENMHQEVARTAQIALEKFPLNRDLRALLAQVQFLLGEPEEALNNAYTALSLSQDTSASEGFPAHASLAAFSDGFLFPSAGVADDDIRRLVIDSLEAIGAWQAALDERRTLMDSPAAPTLDDLHALMYCAMQAEQPEQAIQASQKALEINPEDLLAHQRLAEASLMLEDYPTAAQHFNEGICLAPDKAALWLGLAKSQRLAGEDAKSLSTLRAASQAVPDEPEVHLTLGECYLEKGELTQALACLRRAANLASVDASFSGDTSPASERVALRLGQALFQLGHLEEACQVLSKAYEQACGMADETESKQIRQPACSNLELAYTYARTLLGLKELALAIPMLTEVVRSQPDNPEPSLDLARALLLVEDQPAGAQRAIPFLQRILGVNPDGAEGGYTAQLGASPGLRAEARSILAEAYATVGDWPQSMEAYRKALDEPLNRDPGKQRRLSLGLGLVALRLEQPEMAVAALEEAAQSEPLDASIQRALSEAYLASGLPRDAFQTARAVLDLMPGDLDTLLWFAEQGRRILAQPAATQLPIQEVVVQALRNAIQLAPGRPDLLFRLGQACLEAGDRSNALGIFRKLASADDVTLWITPAEIYQAAKALRELGESPKIGAQLAISLLMRAVDKYWETSRDQGGKTTSAVEILPLVDLYKELASAHQQEGSTEAALQAIDQALALAPDQIDLHISKADLLYELRWLEAARECLENALRLAPQNPTLRYRIAQVLRSLGELPIALSYAEQAIADLDASQDSTLLQPLHLLAAELSYATLRPQKALAYLQKGLQEADSLCNNFQYASLLAELALDTTGEPQVIQLALATQAVESLEKIASDHPRSQAATACLYGLQGEKEKGRRKCRSAIGLLNDWQTGSQRGAPKTDPSDYITSLLSVSQAALEFRQWEEALSFLRQLVELAPFEPIAHLKLAQALVMRAEAQCLCQDLEVLEHAPGEVALGEETRQLFESSIFEAERRSQDNTDKEAEGAECAKGAGCAGSPDWRNDESKQMLAVWLARGKAVFQPSVGNTKLLEKVLQAVLPTSEDIAAFIMVMRRCPEAYSGEENTWITKATQVGWLPPFDGADVHGHPLVLTQLALSEPDFEKALSIAQEALERVSDRQNPAASIDDWPELAMLNFLQARLAFRAAAYSDALIEIQKALAIWPEEARWHALAAQIYLARDPTNGLPDSTKALVHLEQAARLEPEQASNHLAVGLAYLESGQHQRSVKALEKASQLDPNQPDTWLLLSRAQQAIGDLEGAAASSERAIEKSTDPTQALFLRGEIALQANNPRGALGRAQTILRTQPDNPQALHLLARAMEAMNRPAEALSAMERAMQLLPDSFPMQLERLHLLRRSSGLESALAALQELVTKNPERSDLLALLAEWLLEGGKHEAAIQVARQALQEGQSGLSNKRSADLHCLIGKHMRQVGQLDQAIYHLSKAIEHFADYLEAYLELGKAYQDRREYKQALKVYQKAINIAGNDYRPYYQAGMVLKDSKDYLAAEAMFRRAAQLAPNEVSVHRLLAAVVALNLVHSHRLSSEA